MGGLSQIGTRIFEQLVKREAAPALETPVAEKAVKSLTSSLPSDRLMLSKGLQQARGKASLDFEMRDPQATAKEEMVPLSQVRYTQGEVYHDLKDGRTIEDLAEDLKKNGWNYDFPPPHMVRTPEGHLMTLDHRRLVAAQLAGLKEVPALVHPWNEPLPESEFRRYWIGQPEGFVDKERGTTYAHLQVAKNWGQAARFRAIEQHLRGIMDFPLDGSPNLPEKKGFQPHK